MSEIVEATVVEESTEMAVVAPGTLFGAHNPEHLSLLGLAFAVTPPTSPVASPRRRGMQIAASVRGPNLSPLLAANYRLELLSAGGGESETPYAAADDAYESVATREPL